MANILLVEDDSTLREAFTIILSSNGHTVQPASNGQEALTFWNKHTYDIVLLDLMMPVLDGVGFLKQAQPQLKAPKTRIVILSNLSSGDVLKTALSLGAHRHEVKSSLGPRNVIDIVAEEVAT